MPALDDLSTMFDAMMASMPSEEEIRAKHQAQRDWTSANLIGSAEIAAREGTEAPARFNNISLDAWTALARRSGVPLVELRELARMPVDGYIAAMNHEDDSQLDAFERAVVEGLQPGEMVRCDQKATGEVKSVLSEGKPMNNGLLYSPHFGREILPIHDETFYETMLDHGSEHIVAFARPIVEAKLIDGEFRGEKGRWPAEFRVYVQNNAVVGISNYYPQVDMDPQEFAAAAATAVSHARKMVATMAELRLGTGNHRLCPDIEGSEDARPDWMPATWGHQDFTLDFICTADDEVVFLEGGPAGMQAAHPCCFLQEGREPGPDFLHGAVFSLTGEILPLSAIGA